MGGGTAATPSLGKTGGGQADFQSLIELIQQTVAPTTWNTVGGPGAVMPFQTNLSLVVSQTQEVHEEIGDLLDQLRRLQDLQVTIEVRFITLDDAFAERIGVDFDFNIQTGVNQPLNMTAIPTASGSTSHPFPPKQFWASHRSIPPWVTRRDDIRSQLWLCDSLRH
jgi:general secretion pathway protein D